MLLVLTIRCSGTVLFESALEPRCTNKNVSTKWQEDQEEISENNNDSNHTQQHQTPKLYNTSSKILVVKSVHSLAIFNTSRDYKYNCSCRFTDDTRLYS